MAGINNAKYIKLILRVLEDDLFEAQEASQIYTDLHFLTEAKTRHKRNTHGVEA